MLTEKLGTSDKGTPRHNDSHMMCQLGNLRKSLFPHKPAADIRVELGRGCACQRWRRGLQENSSGGGEERSSEHTGKSTAKKDSGLSTQSVH
jgi:hypothetical protein